MRAFGEQSMRTAVLETAWPWAGRGSVVMGLAWLLALPRRWLAAWPSTARRLADDPATFVNHR